MPTGDGIFIFVTLLVKVKNPLIINNKMKIKLLSFTTCIAAMLLFAGLASAQKCTENGSIKRVSKASAGKYETVTFEVLSKSPNFEVTTARPPFSEYGSEKTLRIRGTYYKSVVFRDINWTCKITESLSAKTSNIKAVKNIEQFEGQAEYIIGYAKKGSYVGQTSKRTKRGKYIILKFKK